MENAQDKGAESRQKCAVEPGGKGGFAARELSSSADLALNRVTLVRFLHPSSGSFVKYR